MHKRPKRSLSTANKLKWTMWYKMCGLYWSNCLKNYFHFLFWFCKCRLHHNHWLCSIKTEEYWYHDFSCQLLNVYFISIFACYEGKLWQANAPFVKLGKIFGVPHHNIRRKLEDLLIFYQQFFSSGWRDGYRPCQQDLLGIFVIVAFPKSNTLTTNIHSQLKTQSVSQLYIWRRGGGEKK